jgi:hypothetical protein
MRTAVLAALEIRDEADILRGLNRGELEARTRQAERARASAPPDVSRQLRLTAQAEADAWQQSADAATRHDQAGAANAAILAGQLTAGRRELEADNACYEKWSAATASTRETAAKAQAELERRGITAAADGPDGRHTPDHQAIRVGELLWRSAEAAGRLAAERRAPAEYSARVERESRAQPTPDLDRRAEYDAEMEL